MKSSDRLCRTTYIRTTYYYLYTYEKQKKEPGTYTLAVQLLPIPINDKCIVCVSICDAESQRILLWISGLECTRSIHSSVLHKLEKGTC